MKTISLDEPEHKLALEEAMKWVQESYEFNVPMMVARSLVEEFLFWLDSEDRDFSDEMLEARKTFKKLTEEHPDECPSKLWDDALESVGKN